MLAACNKEKTPHGGGEGDGNGGGGGNPTPARVTGVVQKGPFIKGSRVTLAELDEKLTPTGRTFGSTITNDRGEFTFPELELASAYVQLTVDGFYFHELTNELSTAPITLYALADINEASTVNVNVLTHLETERVRRLVTREGQTFTRAKAQALAEVLAAFHITEKTERAETLDLAAETDGAHMLLAISSILLNGRTEAELTRLLAEISDDLSADGILDNSDTQNLLRESAMDLWTWGIVGWREIETAYPVYRKLDRIRENMQKRYAALGQTIGLEAFERYIDRYGNGDLSENAFYDFSDTGFTPTLGAEDPDRLYFSDEIVLSGITDSVLCWVPNTDFGYKGSVHETFTFHAISGSVHDMVERALRNYDIDDRFEYYLKTDYISSRGIVLVNGGVVYKEMSNPFICISPYHIFVNDQPIEVSEQFREPFYLHPGDRIRIAMNPYHRLYNYKHGYRDDETHPFNFNGPREGEYAGQTARALLYIEGQRIEYTVSVVQ